MIATDNVVRLCMHVHTLMDMPNPVSRIYTHYTGTALNADARGGFVSRLGGAR